MTVVLSVMPSAALALASAFSAAAVIREPGVVAIEPFSALRSTMPSAVMSSATARVVPASTVMSPPAISPATPPTVVTVNAPVALSSMSPFVVLPARLLAVPGAALLVTSIALPSPIPSSALKTMLSAVTSMPGPASESVIAPPVELREARVSPAPEAPPPITSPTARSSSVSTLNVPLRTVAFSVSDSGAPDVTLITSTFPAASVVKPSTGESVSRAMPPAAVTVMPVGATISATPSMPAEVTPPASASMITVVAAVISPTDNASVSSISMPAVVDVALTVPTVVSTAIAPSAVALSVPAAIRLSFPVIAPLVAVKAATPVVVSVLVPPAVRVTESAASSVSSPLPASTAPASTTTLATVAAAVSFASRRSLPPPLAPRAPSTVIEPSSVLMSTSPPTMVPCTFRAPPIASSSMFTFEAPGAAMLSTANAKFVTFVSMSRTVAALSVSNPPVVANGIVMSAAASSSSVMPSVTDVRLTSASGPEVMSPMTKCPCCVILMTFPPLMLSFHTFIAMSIVSLLVTRICRWSAVIKPLAGLVGGIVIRLPSALSASRTTSPAVVTLSNVMASAMIVMSPEVEPTVLSSLMVKLAALPPASPLMVRAPASVLTVAPALCVTTPPTAASRVSVPDSIVPTSALIARPAGESISTLPPALLISPATVRPKALCA